MAKISARGATKICSVEFTKDAEDGEPALCVRLTACSDGRVLRQIRYDHTGQLSGFTRFGSLKNTEDARAKMVRFMVRRGWTEATS